MPINAAVAGVAGLATVGTGLATAISGGKEAKRLREEIDNYKRQELLNPFEGLQVSTLGADRQREDLARTMATYGTMSAMGGSRAMAAMMPNLISKQNEQSASIAANLDQQEAQRQQLIAQGNGMVQQMTEQRERDDLLGLGNALDVANQNKQQGINTIAQGVGGLGTAAVSGVFDGLFKGNGKINPLTRPTQAGLNITPMDSLARNVLPNNINYLTAKY